ncbi:hypothetical protein BDQ17DRAFT_1328607 [Cyathus striatus]|nr:hypothetical protein BDQ17DRAFT_1328607 [Cyathus striatus]
MIDAYPPNSRENSSNSFKSSIKIKRENAADHSFSKKSTENGVAIGPLEYCGNGRVLVAHRRKIIATVRGHLDKKLTESDIRHLVTKSWRAEYIQREKNKLVKKAAKKGIMVREEDLRVIEKRKLPEAAKAERNRRIQSALREHKELYGDLYPSASISISDNSEPPVKKRRISVDKKLALSSQQVEMERSLRTRTPKL